MMNKTDEISKILIDFNTQNSGSNIHDFYKAGTACTNTIAALSSDYNEAIIAKANDLLAQLKNIDSEHDNTEYLFQILIEALQIKEVDNALILIHAALRNKYAEDHTKYINLLRFHPQKEVIPIFLEILPLLESWDEDGGEPQEIIIDKLNYWNINIPNAIIIKALSDEADKVRRAIIRYIKHRDLKIYAPYLINLENNEDSPQ